MQSPKESSSDLVADTKETPPLLIPATQPAQDKSIPKIYSNFSSWAILGIICVVLIVGVLGGFGVAAPLASAIVAPGRVAVDTNTKEVAHLEGGVVKRLAVRNGTYVKAGDLLVELDETRVSARLTILRTRMDENLTRIARFNAEAGNAETIIYPAELTERKGDFTVRELLASEREVFEARRLTNLGQKSILEQRVEQLKQEIIGQEAQLDAEKRRKVIIDQEVAALEPLFEKGLINLQRILALRREAVQLEGQIGALIANIARSKQSIGETQLQIIQGEKEFKQNVLTELAQTQSTLKDIREQYAAAADQMARSDMRAPVSGIVANLSVHAKDAVVRPGEPVLEIVPVDDDLLIEVQIQPQDVDNVGIDQQAQIRMTAFKQRSTPLINGSVAFVSPDTIINNRSGAAHYVARIAVSKEELDRLGDVTVNPGMPAEVMITTGSRTAVQYLVQPIVESMNRAWRED